ncbi:unnamed protein product [Blepharisma stoltei]|uniref:Uncharacterized protein n=1 Tax=Blepharisma stoltei TaxID=1481888 RepID=A0AAU9KEY2_9CILI|nr:unnamed protein product [Blepharisma stoltei]
MAEKSFLTLSDAQISNELIRLIWRFSNLKEYNNIRIRRITKRRNTHRKSSSTTAQPCYIIHNTDSPIIEENSTYPNISPLISRRKMLSVSLLNIEIHKQPKNVYTTEQYSCISSTFISLLEAYQGTSWVKYDEFQSLVHSALIKQFFLDCYTCDHSFWSLIIDPISNKPWVDIELFKTCLENLQESHNWNLFSPKKINKKKKNLWQIQKYLFFFSFIQKTAGDELDRDQLMEALSMADKAAKYQIVMLSDIIFQKLNESEGCMVKYINFEQFKSLIVEKKESDF